MIQMFTVFDAAAQRYLEPFHAQTIEFALRQFRSTVEEPGHMFAKYPEDYTLFHIGSYDLETGVIEGFSTPHRVAQALEFSTARPAAAPMLSNDPTHPVNGEAPNA